jgi:hypothetical protein
MPNRDGLLITGHAPDATCVACNRQREGLYVEATNGGFTGWVCFTHLKPILRLSLANRSRPERGTPQLDGNGAEREAVRA